MQWQDSETGVSVRRLRVSPAAPKPESPVERRKSWYPVVPSDTNLRTGWHSKRTDVLSAIAYEVVALL